eukprot:SAG31_NODE_536_length_14340_cov_9.449196_1_plen_616_part_00
MFHQAPGSRRAQSAGEIGTASGGETAWEWGFATSLGNSVEEGNCGRPETSTPVRPQTVDSSVQAGSSLFETITSACYQDPQLAGRTGDPPVLSGAQSDSQDSCRQEIGVRPRNLGSLPCGSISVDVGSYVDRCSGVGVTGPRGTRRVQQPELRDGSGVMKQRPATSDSLPRGGLGPSTFGRADTGRQAVPKVQQRRQHGGESFSGITDLRMRKNFEGLGVGSTNRCDPRNSAATSAPSRRPDWQPEPFGRSAAAQAAAFFSGEVEMMEEEDFECPGNSSPSSGEDLHAAVPQPKPAARTRPATSDGATRPRGRTKRDGQRFEAVRPSVAATAATAAKAARKAEAFAAAKRAERARSAAIFEADSLWAQAEAGVARASGKRSGKSKSTKLASSVNSDTPNPQCLDEAAVDTAARSPRSVWLDVSGKSSGDDEQLPALSGQQVAEVLRRLHKPVSASELAYIVDTLGGRATGLRGGMRLISFEAFEVWWTAMLEEFAAWCQEQDEKSAPTSRSLEQQNASDDRCNVGPLQHHQHVSQGVPLADEPATIPSTETDHEELAKLAELQHAQDMQAAVRRSRAAAEQQRWEALIHAKQQARVANHRTQQAIEAQRTEQKRA